MPEDEEGADDDDRAGMDSLHKRQRQRVWVKEDIQTRPLPSYIHPRPEYIRQPSEYFRMFFTTELKNHIVYQTNLYAKQKNLRTNFVLEAHELDLFVGIIIYMGVISAPSITDYWALQTRVPQVADYMSKNRFKIIRATIHFSDNEQARTSKDRFFKIRPLFTKITKEFLKVPETPVNSVDEVMVAYKGTMAGNLRQYICDKPDSWGYKLFCRSSDDGFIHDILMYQGEPTFETHHQELSEEELKMSVTAKFVIVLAKTLKNPDRSAIYADNYFSSLSLAEYLMSKYKCRYVGTARENRVGHPPLQSVKAMNKKTVPKGEMDFASCDGLLVCRWKDNKVVTLLSTDAGVEPEATVTRYDREAKEKKSMKCPNVVKQYNGRMGGIDKSDMLTHLYKTPMRSKRYYMRLFGYVIDLIICNAWLLYKRDCQALDENAVPLKKFRMDISSHLRISPDNPFRVTRASTSREDVPLPRRGQRAARPSPEERMDATKLHMPLHVDMRQTCKLCSHKGTIHRSRWMCQACKVALCLSDARNCFTEFHVN